MLTDGIDVAEEEDVLSVDYDELGVSAVFELVGAGQDLV